jgi:hypothetical protein
MGKNVGSNPRQRSRRPRHASSSLSQRRDFGVSSARRSMHGISGARGRCSAAAWISKYHDRARRGLWGRACQ